MISRRGFVGAGAAIFAARAFAEEWKAPEKNDVKGGFDEAAADQDCAAPWQPYSDRKVKVGIAGEGVCNFGSAFGYQNHPNVEVVACTDLDPEKRRLLQERTGAKKAYPSCEEMIAHAAEDGLEAVYIATDAPSHARLSILALEHGLHVVCAVPAFLGREQLDMVPKLMEAVRKSGKVYQMNETTAFRQSCYEMRRLYEAGAMGEIVYAEGEYFHCSDLKTGLGVGSYNGWREGIPPMYYPTHSTGFYTCVTRKRFTEVTCIGKPSLVKCYVDGNRYDNPFGSEFALMKTEDGGSARMLVAYDVPCVNGERGRVWGQRGGYDDAKMEFLGDPAAAKAVDYRRHGLPKGMPAGGHGGSHGYLTDDFIHAILDPKHRHVVDAAVAVNTTICGVYAHLSAIRGGETLKLPPAS